MEFFENFKHKKVMRGLKKDVERITWPGNIKRMSDFKFVLKIIFDKKFRIKIKQWAWETQILPSIGRD